MPIGCELGGAVAHKAAKERRIGAASASMHTQHAPSLPLPLPQLLLAAVLLLAPAVAVGDCATDDLMAAGEHQQDSPQACWCGGGVLELVRWSS